MSIRSKVGDGSRWHDAGYGVFIDELSRPPDGIEQDGKGIEPANHSSKLYAVDEVDGYADVLFADLIQKDVLKIELRLVHDCATSPMD
jgi:hypothetical protein